MQEFIVNQVVWAVAMPLGIAAVCMVIAWRPWKREARESIRGHWGGAPAIGFAYLIGHVAINKWPNLPPAQPTDFLFLIACAAIIIGLLESLRMPAAARWALRLLVCTSVSWFMLSKGFRTSQPGGVVAMWTAGQALSIFLVWTLLERLAQRRTGPSIPLALSLLIAVASVFFLKASSGKLAQLAGVLSAALGGVSLVTMIAPRISTARGMLAVIVPLYCGLLLYAWQYPQPWGTPIILAAAPLLLWMAEWRESVTSVMSRSLLAMLPALIALILLLWHALDQTTGESLY